MDPPAVHHVRVAEQRMKEAPPAKPVLPALLLPREVKAAVTAMEVTIRAQGLFNAPSAILEKCLAMAVLRAIVARTARTPMQRKTIVTCAQQARANLFLTQLASTVTRAHTQLRVPCGAICASQESKAVLTGQAAKHALMELIRHSEHLATSAPGERFHISITWV